MSTIRVMEPFGGAIERTTELLFRPLCARKWLGMAVVCWLTTVGLGSGMSYMQGLQIGGSLIPWGAFFEWMSAHPAIFCVYASAAASVLFGIYWLYCVARAWGHLGLITQIVENSGEIRACLRPHGRTARKLGWFFVMWEFAEFNITAVGVICAAGLAAPDVVHSWKDLNAHLTDILTDLGTIGQYYHWSGWSIAALAAMAMVLAAAKSCFWALALCVEDLTIPIVYHTKMTPWTAFGYTLTHVIFRHPKPCVLYLLMSILSIVVTAMMSGTALWIIYACTCLGGAFLLYVPVLSNLPILGVVALTLPVWVFMRAYSLKFLEQFEERFGIVWVTIRRGGFPVVLDDSGSGSG